MALFVVYNLSIERVFLLHIVSERTLVIEWIFKFHKIFGILLDRSAQVVIIDI